MCTSDIFLALLAVLFPPIAVWIKRGICSLDSVLNILLCVLGYIPGLLHSWYIIAKYPEEDMDTYEVIPANEEGRSRENQTVTYYYVNQNPGGRMNYGGTQQSNNHDQQNQQQAPPAQSHEGQGSSQGGVPPTYEQAVEGDHKVQT